MTEFNAHAFVTTCASLAACEEIIGKVESAANVSVPAEMGGILITYLDEIGRECTTMALQRSIEHNQRITAALKGGCTFGRLRQLYEELRNRISDEIKCRMYLAMSEEEAAQYKNPYPFGIEVEDKFPRASEDIHEAAKCIATGRSTACVFHLMRVMEMSVQQIAKRLGILATRDKTWQKILDELNAPINALPQKTRAQKEKKKRYAQAHAYLFTVKLAWRNEVMHPKATYTEEEARNVMDTVRAFVRYLVCEL